MISALRRIATRSPGVAAGSMTNAHPLLRCVLRGHDWQQRPDEDWRVCQRCGWDEQVGW